MSAISAISSRVDLTLVVERCGDRLELEGHVLEADLPGDIVQHSFCLSVGRGGVVDEMHRPAVHDAAQLAADGLLRPPLHRAKIVGDDIAEAFPAGRRQCVLSSISEVPSTDFRLRISRPGRPST